jgi:hypothetical protein
MREFMPTRAALQQEIADAERTAVAMRKEVDDMQNQPESLRAITQEALARARADLSRKEADLGASQAAVAASRLVLTKMQDMETKQQEITKLERDQETIANLLEKARTDFKRIEDEYLALTGPVTIPGFTLLLADGKTLPLPTDRAEMTLGLLDQADKIFPDVDLTPAGGKTSGVSRRHAQLRYQNNHGAWLILAVQMAPL